MVKKEVEDLEEFDEDLDAESDSEDFGDDSYDDLTDDYFGDESVTPMDKHNDLLKGLTDFEPYLKDTFYSWLGLIWSDEDEKYVPDNKVKPILSSEGGVYCLNFLKTYNRGNNIITNISKGDYIDMCSDMIEDVLLNLGTRPELGHKGELISDGDLLAVLNKLLHSAFLILMGAGDGKYNQFLSTTVSRTEHINPGQGYGYGVPQMPIIPIKKGLIGKLKETLVGNQDNFRR